MVCVHIHAVIHECTERAGCLVCVHVQAIHECTERKRRMHVVHVVCVHVQAIPRDPMNARREGEERESRMSGVCARSGNP